MSENTNTFITGEVYPYQITDRTLSFIPKLSPAADDHFKELVTGKIKISLYDFSNGKGDNGIYTYFNLDLKQLSLKQYLLLTDYVLPFQNPFLPYVHGS